MKSGKLLKLLYVQVLIGLVFGIAVGHYWPDFGASLKPLGDGFVKLVKMMIAPVVFCTIVSGHHVAGRLEGDRQDAAQGDGPLLCADDHRAAHRPGRGVPAAAGRRHAHRPEESRRRGGARSTRARCIPHGFTEFVMHIIPNAFFGAFAEGEVLPVLLLAVLCGFGLTRIGAAGEAGARRHRRLLPHAVRRLRHHHAAGTARRFRRDGIHRRALRHQVDRIARAC